MIRMRLPWINWVGDTVGPNGLVRVRRDSNEGKPGFERCEPTHIHVPVSEHDSMSIINTAHRDILHREGYNKKMKQGLPSN